MEETRAVILSYFIAAFPREKKNEPTCVGSHSADIMDQIMFAQVRRSNFARDYCTPSGVPVRTVPPLSKHVTVSA